MSICSFVRVLSGVFHFSVSQALRFLVYHAAFLQLSIVKWLHDAGGKLSRHREKELLTNVGSNTAERNKERKRKKERKNKRQSREELRRERNGKTGTGGQEGTKGKKKGGYLFGKCIVVVGLAKAS